MGNEEKTEEQEDGDMPTPCEISTDPKEQHPSNEHQEHREPGDLYEWPQHADPVLPEIKLENLGGVLALKIEHLRFAHDHQRKMIESQLTTSKETVCKNVHASMR